MSKTFKRQYVLYGDMVEVDFTFNEPLNRYFGEYPDFDKSPRTTPCGRQWVNATKENCPFADKNYGDCGSCNYYRCEHPGDLIGVCDNAKFREEEIQ